MNSEPKMIPYLPFYTGDHRRDTAIQLCTLGERGLYFEVTFLMHDGDPYGHLRVGSKDITIDELARLVGDTPRTVKRLLAQLEQVGVFKRTDTGTLYSPKLIRDHEIRQKRAQGGFKSLQHPNVQGRRSEGEREGSVGGRQEGYPSNHPSIDPSYPSFKAHSYSESVSGSVTKRQTEEGEVAVSASPSTADTRRRPGKVQLADSEFIAALKANEAYQHIDIDREINKFKAWLLTPKGKGKALTRNRLLNWLNRIDTPMQITKPEGGDCAKSTGEYGKLIDDLATGEYGKIFDELAKGDT